MNDRFCKMCKKQRQWWEFSDNFKSCDDCRKKNRERNRKAYQENPEPFRQKEKAYRESHKEEIAKRKKQYNEDNKEKIQAWKKEYMKLIYKCPVCNYDVKLYKKSQHEKSKTHLNNVILGELEEIQKAE